MALQVGDRHAQVIEFAAGEDVAADEVDLAPVVSEVLVLDGDDLQSGPAAGREHLAGQELAEEGVARGLRRGEELRRFDSLPEVQEALAGSPDANGLILPPGF